MRREVAVAEPVLQVRDLCIAWRSADGRANRVVDGVSFDLAAGATLGIAGESGSGKSTLARALLGHCRAGSAITGGSLRLDGDDLAALSEAELARRRGRVMAMVPQNPLASLTFHMPVGRQLEEVLRLRAGLSAKAAGLRAQVEISREAVRFSQEDRAALEPVAADELGDRFEADLAAYTGAKHAVAVVNGTAALHVALRLAGVQPGDEVLIPALTFVATANAVAYCDAIPHFVDSADDTLGVDPQALRTYLSRAAELRGGQCVNRATPR
jgi:ABC-type Fe3+/spermidine/putrescine transport system ATPase subunit